MYTMKEIVQELEEGDKFVFYVQPAAKHTLQLHMPCAEKEQQVLSNTGQMVLSANGYKYNCCATGLLEMLLCNHDAKELQSQVK